MPRLPSELPSGPLSHIAGYLPAEDLPNFLLVSTAWCAAGREQVISLKPKEDITDSQLERLLEVFPFVETLNISRCDKIIAPQLGHLPHLKAFKAAQRFAGAPGSFRSCPKLEELDFDWCETLSDATLEGLENCRQLRKLNLRGCRKLTDTVLPTIAAMTGLRSLKLRWVWRMSSVNP